MIAGDDVFRQIVPVWDRYVLSVGIFLCCFSACFLPTLPNPHQQEIVYCVTFLLHTCIPTIRGPTHKPWVRAIHIFSKEEMELLTKRHNLAD